MRDPFDWRKHARGLLGALAEMAALVFVAAVIAAALGGLE